MISADWCEVLAVSSSIAMLDQNEVIRQPCLDSDWTACFPRAPDGAGQAFARSPAQITIWFGHQAALRSVEGGALKYLYSRRVAQFRIARCRVGQFRVVQRQYCKGHQGRPLGLLTPCLAHPRALSGRNEEFSWFCFNPVYEGLKFTVRQQSLDGRILARQLGLGQQRMHLAVAHAMQELCLPPALALGNEVVRVALCWRNLAVAQRTDHDIVKPRIQGVSPNGAGAAG